jgi:type III pantothenate kinase
MNLVVDIGNNFFKLGIFENSNLVFSFFDKNDKIDVEIEKIIRSYSKITSALISNVSSIKINDILNKLNIKIYELDSTFIFPFKLNYKTPESLGNDRLALAAAATTLFPNSNNLVIDAGTCITIDFIDNNNHFIGGSISPGVKMRYDSLNHYTANLPLLKNENNFNYPGDSTNASIHAGIIGGVSNEINGFIKQINSRNDKVNVILTGGDAKILSKTLKITIFANQNFILEGLNSILNLNKN